MNTENTDSFGKIRNIREIRVPTSPDHFCRDADGGCARRDVFDDDGARADRGPRVDGDADDGDAADAQKRAFAHLDFSGEMDARRDMRVVVDHTVVIDRRAGVDDAVPPHHRPRLRHRAREHHRPCP